MRFIGRKDRLLDWIAECISASGVSGGTFVDPFAGTAAVSVHFKRRGFRVVSADLLYASYAIQRARVQNSVTSPRFTNLLRNVSIRRTGNPLESVCAYLTSLPGRRGFIYQNYTPQGTRGQEFERRYFSGPNGAKIDAIRMALREWHANSWISNREFFILLAALIESTSRFANVAGVYAAFLKTYDPRAVKPFRLLPVTLVPSDEANRSVHGDGVQLAKKTSASVLYLDPPYNSRQYGANYHLLETIARYDNPVIKGKTGMRDYADAKSMFCTRVGAMESLRTIAREGSFDVLALSYNSEGLMSEDEIRSALEEFGTVRVFEAEYRRYKSQGGPAQRAARLREQLYLLK